MTPAPTPATGAGMGRTVEEIERDLLDARARRHEAFDRYTEARDDHARLWAELRDARAATPSKPTEARHDQ